MFYVDHIMIELLINLYHSFLHWYEQMNHLHTCQYLNIIFRGKSFINVMNTKWLRMLLSGTPCDTGIVDDVANLN